MNKVFIRTRQIDNNKQLPIILRENDDLSDFNEYSNISRSSQILSGMDKCEESELHLQEVLRELQYEKTAVNTGIPIPEVNEESEYNSIYQTDFIFPKSYVRLKTLEFEDGFPDYDLDDEDNEWLENSRLDVTSVKFEKIVEEFERACSQKALLLDEAKSLLRDESRHIVIAIYDYWLTKRVRSGQPLFPSVKAEKAERCNNTPIDPYIAFRKRSEKMTTRKNRRVDESSYEKMCRLRCHMEKLSETIEFVSKREVTKSQIAQIERDIFIKRHQCRDYDKLHLKESEGALKEQFVTMSDSFKSAQRVREESHREAKRKRPHSSSLDTNLCSVEIDFTFRPMVKCKYLPPRERQFTSLSSFPSHEASLGSRSCRHGADLRHAAHSRTSLTAPSSRLSRLSESTVTRLHTLYIRDVNCGLAPLTMPTPHDDSQRHTPPPVSLSRAVKTAPQKSSKHYTNDAYSKFFGDSKFSELHCQDSDCNGVCNQLTTNLYRDDRDPPQDPLSKPKHPLSSHYNGNLCTYQNPSFHKDHHSNHAFIQSDRNANGRKRSTVTAMELVDQHSHHSLNVGFPSNLSRMSLQCLKSLTSKRLRTRDDIDELTDFYSKSNGGHHANQCLAPPWKSDPLVLASVNKMA